MKMESKDLAAKRNTVFVVLIDDDEVDNEWHAELIRESGLADKVECFIHVADALRYFKNCLEEGARVPDLVFLDYILPPGNCFDQLDEYRKLSDPFHLKKRTKFVVLSGVIMPELTEQVGAGYSDLIIACLEKPLTPKVFEDIVLRYNVD